MPDTDTFNLLTNVVTLIGGALLSAVIIYILMQVRRLAQQVASVLAPKTGIENHLNMCAQVVESDPDGTCVVADSGEIVLVNRRMEQISGYHRSELLGQQVEILVPEMYRGVHPGHRDSYLVEPGNRPMRGLSLRHKRGRDIPVGIELGHYPDPSGGYTIAKVRASNSDHHASGEWPR